MGEHKRTKTLKQIKKAISYQEPTDRHSCSNCIQFVHNIGCANNNYVFYCLQYKIHVRGFSICAAYKPV